MNMKSNWMLRLLVCSVAVLETKHMVSAQCKDFAEIEITLPSELYESVKLKRDQILVKEDWEKILWMDEAPTVPSKADCANAVIQENFPILCEKDKDQDEDGEEDGSTDEDEKFGRFLLRNVAEYLDLETYPHQGCAVEHLMEKAPKEAVDAFTCEFENKPVVAGGCGPSTVLKQLGSLFKPEANPYQTQALNRLQSKVEQLAPEVWTDFIGYWRKQKVCVTWEIRSDGRCGPDFGDAGCSPTQNYCCSPGGWCGVTELHCPPTPGAHDFRTGPAPLVSPADMTGRFCKDSTGFMGVCVKESVCSAAGGTTKSNLCMGLPADVKCCQAPDMTQATYQVTGPACFETHPSTGGAGVCMETSECTRLGGTTADKLCPGGNSIKCCAGANIIPKATVKGERCKSSHSSGLPGVCTFQSICGLYGGKTDRNKCPGGANVRCCAGKDISPVYEESEKVSSSCGVYSGAQSMTLEGNGGVKHKVVKIHRSHLTSPSIYNSSPTSRDNTMTTATACAFASMASAAAASGVRVRISSGFRTVARQRYFYRCYKCKCCNGGNLAAVPGRSNHGRGVALDVNTSCGRQSGSRPPSACRNSSVYRWLAANAHRFGFRRAVRSEPWHWEYHGAGTSKTSYT